MPELKEVDPNKLIASAAAALQPLLKPPAWAAFARTGVSKERPPQQPDWWFIRSAAILRALSEGSLGVSRLRSRYGSRKNRGVRPEHRYPASGAVIRKALQQLEAAGLVRAEKGKGRMLTPKGASFLSKAAKAAGQA